MRREDGRARPAASPLYLLRRSSSPFLSPVARRKIGVNRIPVKRLLCEHGIRSAFVPDSTRTSRPTPSAGRAFARKAGRWTIGILVSTLVVCVGVLWLYNRNFTSEKKVVRASRFTSGNTIFPVQVAVFADRVARYKPRFLGHTEDSITLRQIASVKVQAGPVFADVVIDTTGGSPPVVVHGLWKKDAEALSGAIAAAQALSPMPVRPVPTPAPPATAPPG